MAETSFDVLRSLIRDVPDHPEPGIVFKDITPLLASGQAFRHACYAIAGHYWDQQVDLVAGPESRGFLFGTGVALGVKDTKEPPKLIDD